ncbi:TfuA-like protein [Streptomyces sparsogenes]|uniref:TfuA-like protein n=1 Tax=Streptomyces sparsogenes DSM 40356 TaxID=1331668 RepID=A0A1R1S5P1_9ACTN|nr:TfuA-like protein [Streptomyces sparsogenes]OMI33588.1 TfuA-like protein [Streptomyces sparsogenes DSM 40356]
MRTVIFVGPSLPPEEAAAQLPGAEFLPPIERGDIDTLMAQDQPPRRIGIIDGKFLQSFSISPKEILRAMDRGVRVWGSSSMGALRAAELDVYGMTGVGTVYDRYASGAIEDDDEVAITFDSESLRPVCEPMVNIRVATEAALRRGVVGEEDAELFLTTAKSLYFPQRTSAAALHRLKGTMAEPARQRLADFLRSPEAPDAKREDAIALLAAMRQDARGQETEPTVEVAAR